jgi:hypothetical protein
MSGKGAQLREARERLQVTVAEVAASTHLKVLVIDAMERNDFPRLIAPPYAKGFTGCTASTWGWTRNRTFRRICTGRDFRRTRRI